QVALDIRVAPSPKQEVHALLVDHARKGLQERAWSQRHTVQHAVVLEPARDERTNPAALKEVVDQEGRLSEGSALLVLAEIQPLEAGKSAGLYTAPAVYETDVELSFFAAWVIHEFALGLDSALAVPAKRREELATSAERPITRAPWAECWSNV